MFYRFPEMKGIPKRTMHDQIQKIKEELQEVEDAYNSYADGDRTRSREVLGLELIDVIHATETALRIAFTDSEVDDLAEKVIKKNEDRGYYKEDK